MSGTDEVMNGHLSEDLLIGMSEVEEVAGVCWVGKQEDMQQQRRCPFDCQHCREEEAREMKELEAAAELERIQSMRTPWYYETQQPVSEPPDINYREIIIEDQKVIDQLFEDENLHFSERCFLYQKQDVCLQADIMGEYKWWIEFMLDNSERTGDETRGKFFEGLFDEVECDRIELCEEREVLEGQQLGRLHERTRQGAAQRLGVPLKHEDWTVEETQRFYNDNQYVPGWPVAERAARRLNISVDHEEWSAEDKRRYFDSDEYADSWPEDGLWRYRAAQRLGIPENHEEWTAEDTKLFYGDDVHISEWRSLERERYRIEGEQQKSGSISHPFNKENIDQSQNFSGIGNETYATPENPAVAVLPQKCEELAQDASRAAEIELAKDESPFPSTKRQSEAGTSHYRPLATLLLTLLLYG